jgi:hypothetical protein
MAKKDPRNVRNWWIESTINGKNTGHHFGPIGREGEFSLKIYQRKEGKAIVAAFLMGHQAKGILDLKLVLTDDKGIPTGPPQTIKVTER